MAALIMDNNYAHTTFPIMVTDYKVRPSVDWIKYLIYIFFGFILSLMTYASVLIIKSQQINDCGFECYCNNEGGFYQELKFKTRTDLTCSMYAP